MSAEQDSVFREKLVALMTALNGGESRDISVRRVVGGYAYQLVKRFGAKSWGDLKLRADGELYDHLLNSFKAESEKFQREGNDKGIRGVEALAVSMIARHQKQPDLMPGVNFLDRYIEDCLALSTPPSSKVVAKPAARH
jgi:hypothetical protein